MKGGGLGNMLWYIILIVAGLNIIAYASFREWKPIIWFITTTIVLMVFNASKTMVVLGGILAAALCKAMYMEGMTKKKDTMKDLHHILSGANLEGMKKQAKHLDKMVNHQKELFGMATQMAPMMKQATEMMKNLPEGFLEKAMQNFNNSKK